MQNQDDVLPTARAVFFCVLSTALVACSSQVETPAATPTAPLGDIALTLKVGQGVLVSAATFSISGNGITPIAGTIPLTDPAATASTLVGGIPAGMNYLFQMDATSTDGMTTCHGSATADVIADATSGVTIILQCRRLSDLGGVTVNVTINNCPTITATAAAPLAIAVGGTINLTAAAIDLDGNPLTVAWSAPIGQLSSTNTFNTNFLCTTEGLVTALLTVSDGQCTDATTVPITCLPFCAGRPDGLPCDDHNACTHSDLCQGSQCVGSDPVICAALDECHTAGVCDPQTALCSNPNATEGTMCTLPNAGAACAAGSCSVQSCTAGFGNCDGAAVNGCEVSLLTSTDNCGACGLTCPTGATCAAGSCLSPPPTGVSAVPGGWTVAVSWQPVLGATGYRVLRATAAAGPFALIGSTTSATHFVDELIATGAGYFYAVATESAGGVSAPSPAVGATPLTKLLCVTSSQGHAVSVFDATQSGRATPVRVITGASTGFGFPKGIASSPSNGELFVSLQGGLVEAFSMAAAGNVAPAWTLSGALGGLNAYALDVDATSGDLAVAEYDSGGKISVLANDTGVVKRQLIGAQTKLGHISSLTIDRAHGELLAGQLDPTGTFSQILTFELTASGDVAPKRTLGTSSSATGAWAIAYDGVHDELFTTCNCNNKVTVFDRTATGADVPKRTLQITGLTAVYGLLLDVASDTLWATGSSGFSTVMIVEVPRGANGAVSPLRTGIALGGVGRLARCN